MLTSNTEYQQQEDTPERNSGYNDTISRNELIHMRDLVRHSIGAQEVLNSKGNTCRRLGNQGPLWW